MLKLYVPVKTEIDGRMWSLVRVAVFSDSQKACCLALFSSDGESIVTELDPLHRIFSPVAIESLEMIAPVIDMFGNKQFQVLCRLRESLSNGSLSGRDGTEAWFAEEGSTRVLYANRPAAWLSPLLVKTPQGESLPFTYAEMESFDAEETSMLALSEEDLGAYEGKSLRDVYLAQWQPGQGQTYGVSGSLLSGSWQSGLLIVRVRSMVIQNLENAKIASVQAHGISRFEMFEYLLKSEDFGVTDISVEGAAPQKRKSMFFVIAIIASLSVSEEVVVGDVHFSDSVDAPEEFVSTIDQQENSCFAWTYESSLDFPSASHEALGRIETALAVLCFYGNPERFPAWGPHEGHLPEWSIEAPLMRPVVSDCLYLENCENGACIVQHGRNQEKHAGLCVGRFIDEEMRACGVQEFMASRMSGAQHYLINAIRWIVKARYEGAREDQIIALNTALEFAITDERGETVLDEIVKDETGDFPDGEFVSNYWERVLSTAALEIPGLSEKQMKKASKRLKGQLKSAANSSSFSSRLACMSHRLADPISNEELKLLRNVNKIRNRLLHGRDTNLLNRVQMDQAIAAATALVSSKIADLRGARK